MPIDWNIVDDDDASVAPTLPSDALDARRIHAIVLERRAAHQARLRAILVPIACAAVAAMAATRAGSLHATRLGAIVYAAIGSAAAWVALRARYRWSRRARAPIEETFAPDFVPLCTPKSATERLSELSE